MHLLTLTLLLALAAPADEPVITKPSPEGAFRAVPEASLRPPRPLDVLHYDLSLTVNDSSAYLRGEVRMRLIPTRDLDRLVLDFTTTNAAPRQGMETLAVEVDGLAHSFVHDADSLAIALSATVTPADTLDVYNVGSNASPSCFICQVPLHITAHSTLGKFVTWWFGSCNMTWLRVISISI